MSVDQASTYFQRVKFADFLGVTLIDVAPERAILKLPYRQEHMNAGGVLNGGASASLLHMAGTVAAWTGIDLDAEPYLGSVDLSIQYLDTSRGEDVIAEAQILRRGRDLFFLEVTARHHTGKPICQGLMTYRAPDFAGYAPRLYSQPQVLSAPRCMTPPDHPWLFRGYVQKLGVTPLHQSPGRVRLHMPCTAVHVNERGHMHAGALASIVDIAGVTATWSLLPRRQGCRGSTIGMQVSYPGTTTEPVVADAHVQQRSEEAFFSTVHVTTAITGQLVAMGQVSYRLLEPRS
jgi:uncharacterized protein (TIGR00369 family)